MSDYNFEIFKDGSIVRFMDENSINTSDLMPFIAEIKIYLKDKESYILRWDDMVIIEKKKEIVNSGLYYLEEIFFRTNIAMEDVDYKQNPVKKKFISSYDPKKGYFFTGNNGIGKTFMATALANLHYNETKEKTLFVFWPDFIEKTKRFGDSNVHYINKVKYAKRLIIDDLGQESITSWSRDDILNSIIAFRLEKKLHTTITSNYVQKELVSIYTLREIEAKKAKSIVNKITALSEEVVFSGKDLRNEN